MIRYTRNLEREAEIARRFKAGETMEAIGESLAPPLCRERVRQLLKRQGVTRDEGGRAEQIRKQGGTVVDLKRQAARDRIMPSYGCSRGEARDINAGIPIIDEGGPVYYYQQKRGNSLFAGIEWALTLPQWWAIWQASGKWEQRGRTRHGYVMTRRDLSQGFTVENTIITTLSEAVAATRKHERERAA